jgi:FkbM family methyltransferase
MREFIGFQKLVRKNFLLYLFARKIAVYFCRYFNLEEGFAILKFVSPREGTVAIDVGSNDGTSVALIFKHLPGAEIHCFDPIREPIVQKSKSKQVTFTRLGLGSRRENGIIFTPQIGKRKLTQYSSMNCESMLSTLGNDLKFDNSNLSVLEMRISIDRLDNFQLAPFFLKLDVEGHELDVLEGSIETITTWKPIILVEIQNSITYQKIDKFMKKYKYENIVLKKSRFGRFSIEKSSHFSPVSNNYLWVPFGSNVIWKDRLVVA